MTDYYRLKLDWFSYRLPVYSAKLGGRNIVFGILAVFMWGGFLLSEGLHLVSAIEFSSGTLEFLFWSSILSHPTLFIIRQATTYGDPVVIAIKSGITCSLQCPSTVCLHRVLESRCVGWHGRSDSSDLEK